MKKCSKCDVEKELDQFEFRKDTENYSGRCKDCLFKYRKEYRDKNKNSIIDKKKKYYQDNKDSINKKNKDNKLNNAANSKVIQKRYRDRNREKILISNKEYKNKNRDSINAKGKLYYNNNKERIRSIAKKAYMLDGGIKCKKYYSDNKNIIKEYYNLYKKNKRISSPIFALKEAVSRQISTFLSKIGNTKNGESSWKFLPYTAIELKNHIESLFETWMSWDNRGVYRSSHWDDNDQSTWRWQLDHIIPHSKFNYTTMDCQEFRDCWALSNLRPLSAKQNILDGNRR